MQTSNQSRHHDLVDYSMVQPIVMHRFKFLGCRLPIKHSKKLHANNLRSYVKFPLGNSVICKDFGVTRILTPITSSA